MVQKYRGRSPQHRSRIAADFLARCFAPGETIALLLRRQNLAATIQRIVPLECALTPRYLGWLAHENGSGANIYVAANPLRSGSRKRTKESIAEVRHLYLDLDTDGDARLAALRASAARNGTPVHPLRLVSELQNLLTPDTTLCLDTATDPGYCTFDCDHNHARLKVLG